MKRFTIAVLALFTILLTTQAHADIIDNGNHHKNTNLKVSSLSTNDALNLPDASTIFGFFGTVADKLGAREGFIVDKWGISNYAATTFYTLPSVPVSFDFGMVNADGVATTVDYNLGSFLSGQNDPFSSLFQYIWIGGGLRESNFAKTSDDKATWHESLVGDVQFKVVY